MDGVFLSASVNFVAKPNLNAYNTWG